MHVELEFDWIEAGVVRLEDGRLRFPNAPEDPGIYRFTLDGPGRTIYIGEADRLRRRFQHYRTPGPSQATNRRINDRVVAVLTTGGPVSVATITKAALRIDGSHAILDLGYKAGRLLLESAALTAARLAEETVENL